MNRSSRVVLLLVVVSVAVCTLVYQVVSYLRTPPPPLRLADNITIEEPPPPKLDPEPARKRLDAAVACIPAVTSPASETAKLLDCGQQAMNAGDPLVAWAALSRAQKKGGSTDPAIFEALGDCASRLGLRNHAADAYRRLTQLNASSPAGYIGQARALASLGKSAEGGAVLERGAAAVGKDVRGRLDIAAALDERYESDRALAEATKARAQAPEDDGVAISVAGLMVKMRKYGEAEPLLRGVLSRKPGDRLANRLRGQLALEPQSPFHNPAKAEHYLLTALQADLSDTRAAEDLSRLYLEQRRYRQAAYLAIVWLKANPNSGSARTTLANAYAGLGRADEAARERSRASLRLEIERKVQDLANRRDRTPADVQARLELAKALAESGDFNEAVTQTEAACCLLPASTDPPRLFRDLCQKVGVTPPSLEQLKLLITGAGS